MEAVSTKPYLLRAIYEWCVDQGYTPHLAVVVDSRTRVPAGYVKEGQIVLNIGPLASNQLQMGNDLITFQARFNGQVQHLSVPVDNVAAIYARENGEGMGFDVVGASTDATASKEDSGPTVDPSEPLDPPPTGPEGKRPRLAIVK